MSLQNLPTPPSLDILRVIGNDTPLHRVTAKEAAGPCPFCGGKDRFRVNTERNRWWCRRCNETEHWSDGYAYIQLRDHLTFAEARTKMADALGLPAPIRAAPITLVKRGPVTETYDYLDETGVLLYQVRRHEPKTFSQRRPNGTGGWIPTLGDTRRVLYRLPELLAVPDAAVYVVEGERDVETLVALGLVATCNPGGAGKWRPEYGESLRGRQVVILPDTDQPGADHAGTVKGRLAGIAADARIVTLPGSGKDITDWVASGGTRAELERLCLAERPRLATRTLTELLAMTFPAPLWAVPDLIPQGLTLFAGKPKTGKSHLMLQCGMGIAVGGRVFGSMQVEAGTVLYLDMENGEELLQERVIDTLHGQPCPANFHYATVAPRMDDTLIATFETWMDEHPDTRLIVIDTFEAVRGASKANASIYREDYASLRPLADWAKIRRVAVDVLHHISKSMADDVFATISGSFGLTGAVDNLMVLSDTAAGMVLAVKGRRVKHREMSLSFDQATAQWSYAGTAEDAALSNERREITQLLAGADDALYPREIAMELGRKNVRVLLGRMVESGELVRDRGRYALNTRARVTPVTDVTIAPIYSGRGGVTVDVTPPLQGDDPPAKMPYRDPAECGSEGGFAPHTPKRYSVTPPPNSNTPVTPTVTPIVTPPLPEGNTPIVTSVTSRGYAREDEEDIPYVF